MTTQDRLPTAVENLAWAFLANVIEGGGTEKTVTADGWTISASKDDTIALVSAEKGSLAFEWSHDMTNMSADSKIKAVLKYRGMSKRLPRPTAEEIERVKQNALDYVKDEAQ